MYFASLPWYDFPEIRPATDLFWAVLARNLRRRGFRDTPDTLDRTTAYESQWASGRLLFSQACGYDVLLPYSSHLRIVATPAYTAPGCSGHCYTSFAVVHKESRAKYFEDLRGSRCVINAWTSHSGMNALRTLAAPLHRDGRFFSEVRVSGAHEFSLREIDAGDADVATIDCITFELLRRYRPQAVAQVRVLCRCVSMPAPPFVAGAQLSDEEAEKVRTALVDTLEDPALQPVKDVLLLDRIETVPLASYELIATLEREALRCGYGEIVPSGLVCSA